MTTRRRTLALAAVAALVLAAPALADAPRKPIPLGKIFPFLELYLKIPPAERTRFTLAYYLSLDGKPATGAPITIVSPAGRVPATLGPEGRILRLPTLAELQNHGEAEIEPHGASKFGIKMDIQPTTRPAQEMDAGELAATVDQATNAIKSRAGILGFAAPKLSRVVFLNAGGGVAVLANGQTAPLIAHHGNPAYDPSITKGAVRIRLAKAPTRMVLDDSK